MRTPNLRLAIGCLDFWNDLKETVYHCQLTEEKHLIDYFKQVSQLLLVQSIKISSVPYKKCSSEEVEELEIQEKGVSIPRFREYTSEVLLAAYLLLQK